MGKAGRVACIAIPWALTVLSLICLVVVTLPGLANNEMLKSLYFFKVDTSDFRADPGEFNILPEFKNLIDKDLLNLLEIADEDKELEDWYVVGLWNYCYGEYDEQQNDKEITKWCSPRKTSFWFNPVEVWGLEGPEAKQSIPAKLSEGLDAYQKAVKAMVAFYFIAFGLTAGAILVGIAAIFSRWGSLVTTVVQIASGLSIMAFAATATGVYLALFSVFNSVLKPYQIRAIFPSRMMSVIWVGAAAAFVATLFWLVSICCCSGKSKNKTVKAEKTPYTYERVASPYMGGSGNPAHASKEGHPLTSGASGAGPYEPFRHQNSERV